MPLSQTPTTSQSAEKPSLLEKISQSFIKIPRETRLMLLILLSTAACAPQKETPKVESIPPETSIDNKTPNQNLPSMYGSEGFWSPDSQNPMYREFSIGELDSMLERNEGIVFGISNPYYPSYSIPGFGPIDTDITTDLEYRIPANANAPVKITRGAEREYRIEYIGQGRATQCDENRMSQILGDKKIVNLSSTLPLKEN